MAKIAVIFVLFALCSVAMSARLRRDEPADNPLNPLIETLKKLGENTSAFIQNPETQKRLNEIQTETKSLFEKGAEEFQKSAAAVKVKFDQLIKDNEGNAKDLADSASKAWDDLIKPKKN